MKTRAQPKRPSGQMSPEQLGRIAETLVAAKTKREASAIEKEFVRGYYGHPTMKKKHKPKRGSVWEAAVQIERDDESPELLAAVDAGVRSLEAKGGRVTTRGELESMVRRKRERFTEFHFYAVMDRTSVLLDMLACCVGEHPALHGDRELRAAYEKTMDALSALNQVAARRLLERDERVHGSASIARGRVEVKRLG